MQIEVQTKTVPLNLVCPKKQSQASSCLRDSMNEAVPVARLWERDRKVLFQQPYLEEFGSRIVDIVPVCMRATKSFGLALPRQLQAELAILTQL